MVEILEVRSVAKKEETGDGSTGEDKVGGDRVRRVEWLGVGT